jgi:predicted nucleic acid-binding protein
VRGKTGRALPIVRELSVDTDRIVDGLRGREEAIALFEQHGSDGLGVSIISLGEIYEGAEAQAKDMTDHLFVTAQPESYLLQELAVSDHRDPTSVVMAR